MQVYKRCRLVTSFLQSSLTSRWLMWREYTLDEPDPDLNPQTWIGDSVKIKIIENCHEQWNKLFSSLDFCFNCLDCDRCPASGHGRNGRPLRGSNHGCQPRSSLRPPVTQPVVQEQRVPIFRSGPQSKSGGFFRPALQRSLPEFSFLWRASRWGVGTGTPPGQKEGLTTAQRPDNARIGEERRWRNTSGASPGRSRVLEKCPQWGHYQQCPRKNGMINILGMFIYRVTLQILDEIPKLSWVKHQIGSEPEVVWSEMCIFRKLSEATSGVLPISR